MVIYYFIIFIKFLSSYIFILICLLIISLSSFILFIKDNQLKILFFLKFNDNLGFIFLYFKY